MAPRNQKIDALKCLAIVLVIVGHAIVYNSLFATPAAGRYPIGAQWIAGAALFSPLLNVIYSFHMPLFAFLAGYVLPGREGSPLGLVRKRAVGLLLPYVVWLTVAFAFQGDLSLRGAAGFVGRGLLYPQSPGAAWFLYALFGCFVVFALVLALGGREWMYVASAMVVGLLIVVPTGRFGDVLGVFDVAWLYPFLIMGYLFGRHADGLAGQRVKLMVGAAMAWVALLPFIWPVLAPQASWWYPALREALHARGLPGAVVLLYAVRYLCAAAGVTACFFLYDYFKGRALGAQAWVGSRTLGMYVVQTYIFLLATRWGWTNVVVLSAVAFAGSLGVTLLLEQNRWTRLIFLGQATKRSEAATI